MFSPKDFLLDSFKSRVVYQSTCESCGARYVGETVTKNCCVTYVKIREYANFVSNLLAYLSHHSALLVVYVCCCE